MPARIPRGWERAPKSPYGRRHGGRKVWKRYETLAKDHDVRPEHGEHESVLSDTTNTAHAVKRLRLKGFAEESLRGKENQSMKYLATLQDKTQETPKSEF